MAKVALLIGVSEYEPGLNPLPAAVKDIEALRRVLQDPEMGGFDEVKTLANPQPYAIQLEIETLFDGRTKDDLVLLFFSGHGIKDDAGRLYFASRITRKNAKGDLIRSTAVPTSFVHDIMNNSRAKRQAIILDCCFSGAFDPALQAKDDGSVDLQSQLGAEGRVVLTSSSSTQYSFEQQGSDLSIYTRYLVEGIETGAGDRNEDGFVSMLELHEYAASKVQETAPKMTPKIIVLKDKGFEIVLAKTRVTDPHLRYRKTASRYANAGTIRPSGRAVLDMLRQQLRLTAEEVAEIEAEVLRPYQERLANLQQYRETLVAEAEHEYPLSEFAREDLNTLQQMLGLRDEDILPIQQEVEAQFTQQSAAYQQNLVQYEQVLIDAIQRDFPLSQETRQELGSLQQSLGLRDEDITRIEHPLLQQAELRHQEKLKQEAEQRRQEQEKVEYNNKLQRYEQEFSKAVQAEYPLSQPLLEGLRAFQQHSGLKNEDIARIEQPIREPAEAKYREKLKQQEEAERQRQRELEERRRAEYNNKLQRYEQELTKAVNAEYPLNQSIVDRLKSFCQQLELKTEDVVQIERSISKPAEAKYQERLRQQEGAERQQKEREKAEYENKLQRYERIFLKAVQEEYPLTFIAGDELKKTQELLGLKKSDVAQIEEFILQRAEAQYQEKLKQKLKAEAERERQVELKKRQKAEYETKLHRYGEELSQAVKTEYPLSPAAQANLQQLRDSLELTKKDTTAIDQRILQSAEARYQSRKEAQQHRKQKEEAKRQQCKAQAITYVADGIHYFDQGWLDEAVAEYRKAIQLIPNNAVIRYQLGNILQEQNKLDEAIAEFQKATQLTPPHRYAESELFVTSSMKKDYEQEIIEARTSITLNPNDAEAHRKLGGSLWCLGRFEEALIEEEMALRLNPTGNYCLGLAHTLVCLNKTKAAVVEYEKAFNADSNYGNLLYWANALGNSGNFEKAIEFYQEYLQILPNSEKVHHNLGLALYKSNKLEEAIAEFEIAVQRKPKERRFQKSLAAAVQERSNSNLRRNDKRSLLGCRFVDSLVTSCTLDIAEVENSIE